MHRLTTERLYLRDWQVDDKPIFADINADPTVMRYFPKTLTAQESDQLADTLQQRMDENGYGLFAVELIATGEFIGFIGLNVPKTPFDFMPCVEIGWRLAEKFWGHGYATEGARAVLDYAFNGLNLDSVVSFTAKTNLPSQKVMQRLNMTYERDFNHPILHSNSPLYPHVLYRIMKDDFLGSLSLK